MIALRGAARTAMSGKVTSVLARSSASTVNITPLFYQAALQINFPKMVEPPMRVKFSTNFISTNRVATATDSTRSLGTVTRTLKALDQSIVRSIEMELNEVDKNADGRIDAEELKNLLRRHNSAFTDEEILEFSDLFYAGKAGGSISIPDLIEALDEVAAMDQSDTSHRDHHLVDGSCSAEYVFHKSHGYTPEALDIKLTHVEPSSALDKLAFNAVKVVRALFDAATGWKNDHITPANILNRVIFLETIAAVPGMVAAIVRHFRSLRRMERDGGLMNLFLEEANNERMHLLSFIRMKDPSIMFRGTVILSQFGFGGVFLLAYLASPKFCHRFVGYVEEEACSTYTKIINAIENAPEGSELHKWNTQLAPKISRGYWKLGEDGTVLDLMYAVRADEAEHRDVNHACSELQGNKNMTPWNDPEVKLDLMLKKYIKDVMRRGDPKETTIRSN
jgi:hypothetical protein